MKKILFLGLTMLVGSSMYAQKSEISVLPIKSDRYKVGVEVESKLQNNPNTQKNIKNQAKDHKTRATTRWYSYAAAIDTLLGGNTVFANLNGVRIWQDSTVKQVFTGGPGTVNYSSYYNVLDPLAPAFNDPNFYAGEFQIGPANNYTIDTVVVYGEYFRPKGGNPADTLIISLVKHSTTAAQNDIFFYNPGKTSFPEMLTNQYVTGIGADTMMSMATLIPDSTTVNGAVIATNKNAVNIYKKVLTNADTSSFIKGFVFPVNLAVPLGELAGVSVTFKSGSTWVANVDTIANLNNFIGVFGAEGNATTQEYRGNAPDFDANMSGLQFSWVKSDYFPSFYIEGWNAASFDKEIALIDYHVVCNNCGTVNVNDVNDNFKSVSAYPNPASSAVTFALNLNESAKNVKVELTNTLGQVVRTLEIGAVSANNTEKATMRVDDLAPGFYIYTVQADNQRYTSKLLVD